MESWRQRWRRPIEPAPEELVARVRARLDAQARPPGSLGRLEALVVELARAQRVERPRADPARVIVFAADHGIARAHPVSAYSAEVTAKMVAALSAGQATACALARAQRAWLEVIDVGVAGLGDSLEGASGISLVRAPVREGGSRDLVTGAAMRPGELEGALEVGAAAARRAQEQGARVLALGEMGIGNTSSAAALTAALLGLELEGVVGPGAGLDERGVRTKRQILAGALERARAEADVSRPLAALEQLGGLEIAALVGCILEAARGDMAVLLDGFIVGAAALAAARLAPGASRVMIATTRSVEPGHGPQLEALGLYAGPLMEWGMRLGEGSAAALALGTCRAACAVLEGVAPLEQILAKAAAVTPGGSR